MIKRTWRLPRAPAHPAAEREALSVLGADGGPGAASRRLAEALGVDEARGVCGVVLRAVGWEAFRVGGGGRGGLAFPPFWAWFGPGRGLGVRKGVPALGLVGALGLGGRGGGREVFLAKGFAGVGFAGVGFAGVGLAS